LQHKTTTRVAIKKKHKAQKNNQTHEHSTHKSTNVEPYGVMQITPADKKVIEDYLKQNIQYK